MSFFRAFLSFFLVGVLTFEKLPLTFFQQDEWALQSNYNYWDKAHLPWLDRLFLYEQYTHLIPLSNSASYTEFRLFGIHFPAYALVAICIHIINALLVYVLAKKITNNKRVALLAGLIFLTAAIPHQAITWTATTMGTAGSTAFLLITIIFFLKYLEEKEHRWRNLGVTFLGVLFSLGFKESTVFLFLFLPVCWILYRKTAKVFSKLFLFPLTVVGISYFGLRLVLTILVPKPLTLSVALSQPSFFAYGYRLLATPLKVLAQVFLPQSILLSLSKTIVRLGYPRFVQAGTPDPYLVESIGADVISFLFAAIILVICGFLIWHFKKTREKNAEKTILISLCFILLSAFPLIIIPGSAGYFSLVDGRHLYVTTIFSALLLAILFDHLQKWFRRFQFGSLFLFFMLALYIFFNIRVIRSDINQQVGIAYTRKSILNAITNRYPHLPNDVIFYVESDTPYYGLSFDDPTVPFQSGFGQTLLVWYNAHNSSFPACFFKGEYLYDLLSQGYKLCEGKGFGYYRKMTTLKTAVEKDHVLPAHILAFSYHASSNSITDITKKVQKEVAP